MRRASILRRLFQGGLVPAVLCAIASTARGEDWPVWRGTDQHGVNIEAAQPTAWSAESGYAWKTPIPGQGHSSPVVAGDRVYLTTAYPAASREWVRTGFPYLSVILAGLIGVGMLRTVVRTSSQPVGSGSGLLRMASAAAFLAGCAAVMFFVFFGPSAIDYERCHIRAWLGSSILTGLCVLLMGFEAPARSLWRPLIGMAAMFFSVIAFIFVPAADHAFRGGLFRGSAATVWASTLVPFMAGLCTLFNYSVSRKGSNVDGSPVSHKIPRIAKVFYGSAVVVGLLLSAGIGATIIRNRPAPGEETSWRPREVPMDELAFWLLGSIPIVFGVVLLAMAGLTGRHEQRAQRSWVRGSASALGTIALAGLGLAIVIGVLRHLVDVSPYLRYHLGAPKWLPTGGWSSVTAVGVVCGLVLAYELVRIARPAAQARRVPRGFRMLLLATAGITFLAVNVLSNQVAYSRAIMCLEKSSGKIVWTCEGLVGPEGQLHKVNSPATPTPVIHDGRVLSFFGYGGAMAADLAGKHLWENPDIRFKSIYGVGVSPIVFQDLLIIASGTPNEPKVYALDCATGMVRWTQAMGIDDKRYPSGNSRTPLVRTINGRPTLLVWDFVGLTGLDVKSGEKLWSHAIGNGGEGDQVASLVTDDRRVYCAGPLETAALELAKLDQTDSIPEAWRTRIGGSNCSSPLLHSGRLYFVTDHGVGVCLDAATGERLWRERLAGTYYASPVASKQYVYFSNDEGLTTILDATAPEFKVVAKADIGSPIYASFAMLADCVLARTQDSLFRLEQGSQMAAR